MKVKLTDDELNEYEILLDKMMYGAPMTRTEWSRMVVLYNIDTGRDDEDSDEDYNDYCRGV